MKRIFIGVFIFNNIFTITVAYVFLISKDIMFTKLLFTIHVVAIVFITIDLFKLKNKKFKIIERLY